MLAGLTVGFCCLVILDVGRIGSLVAGCGLVWWLLGIVCVVMGGLIFGNGTYLPIALLVVGMVDSVDCCL